MDWTKTASKEPEKSPLEFYRMKCVHEHDLHPPSAPRLGPWLVTWDTPSLWLHSAALLEKVQQAMKARGTLRYPGIWQSNTMTVKKHKEMNTVSLKHGHSLMSMFFKSPMLFFPACPCLVFVLSLHSGKIIKEMESQREITTKTERSSEFWSPPSDKNNKWTQ